MPWVIMLLVRFSLFNIFTMSNYFSTVSSHFSNISVPPAGWRFSDGLSWSPRVLSRSQTNRFRLLLGSGGILGGIWTPAWILSIAQPPTPPLKGKLRPSENLSSTPGPKGTHGNTHGNTTWDPPRGPLDLRFRPRGFPAMPDPIPASKFSSDNQNYHFLEILV